MTKPAISFAGGSALGGATEARDRAGRMDTRPVGCAATDGTVGIATTPICHVLARLNSVVRGTTFGGLRSSLAGRPSHVNLVRVCGAPPFSSNRRRSGALDATLRGTAEPVSARIQTADICPRWST